MHISMYIWADMDCAYVYVIGLFWCWREAREGSQEDAPICSDGFH